VRSGSGVVSGAGPLFGTAPAAPVTTAECLSTGPVGPSALSR
jgi:hypothetical protein